MGARGPKPQPSALKLLRGNPGKRAVNKDEPTLPAPSRGALEPPEELQGAGRAEWERLVGDLVTGGVLTVADMGAFEDYCRGLSDLRRYEAKAKKAGPELAIAKGYQGMVVKLRAQVAQLRDRVGCSPSGRSQVKRASVPAVSKLERFTG